MTEVEILEHAQVSTLLDCVVLLFSDGAMDILQDVLTEDEYEAIKLSIKAITKVSDTISNKLEQEGL